MSIIPVPDSRRDWDHPLVGHPSPLGEPMSKNYGEGYDNNGHPMSPLVTTNPPSWSFPCDKAECGLCNAGIGHSQEQGRTPR